MIIDHASTSPPRPGPPGLEVRSVICVEVYVEDMKMSTIGQDPF